jgi:hypothetical protein
MNEQYCPQCGGEGVLLGGLGNRIHFRCRNCGSGFFVKSDEDDGIDIVAEAAAEAVKEREAKAIAS